MLKFIHHEIVSHEKGETETENIINTRIILVKLLKVISIQEIKSWAHGKFHGIR